MTYRLHDSLGYRLSRAARIQEQRLETGLKTLGLSRLSWCILLAVGVEGHARPSDIAAFIGVDRTAVSRALRQMEDANLIARRQSKADGRSRAVALTDEGHDRLTRGRPFAEGNNAALAGRLNPGDVSRLTELLDRLIEGEPALDQF